MDGNAPGQCPFAHGGSRRLAGATTDNNTWWPNQLNLKVLSKDSPQINPLGADFDYAAAFQTLDLDEVKQDIFALMTDSQDWWPADYGHYGPLFIRMAWHSAGTYRTQDGRGGAVAGTMRFAPLNSWPDNVNLEKARMLLWPVKKKYGRNLSWADLIILTGNCALESMGFETFGFAGGRVDAWEPEQDVYWGPEAEWLGDQRYTGARDLENPLAAVQMGLIYVNPQGPNGNPDPKASAFDVRDTFARMAMNDEETVALVAGGHTFGKCHGAADPDQYVGREPEAAPLEQQGLGWKSSFGSGVGGDAIGSGFEGAWTPTPITWDMSYFDTLLGYEWEQTTSPAGAIQWKPKDPAAATTVPDAHDPAKTHAPMMTTADLALREDPEYRKISERFHKNPDEFARAFARAWYKLTHRDMGPYVRGLGPLVPAEPELWQDPVPALEHAVIDGADIADLKARIAASGLSVSQLVSTAWAGAVTFRGSDMRGGLNGARLALAPQKDWAVNNPAALATVIETLTTIQGAFNAGATGGKQVSLADMIVLGGCVGVETAARNAGHAVEVPFTPGRTDATQDMTDIDAMQVLEPISDGFRNYVGPRETRAAAEALLDRASLLNLSAPEMTALVGGLRMLGTNADGSAHGVFTAQSETLSNDFFVNLLDLGTEWTDAGEGLYQGRTRGEDAVKWTATAVDLVFGGNSELRAISEVYGSDDGAAALVRDFAKAWNKVMMLDRFDIAGR